MSLTRATDCLDQMLKRLHEVEDKIEHENMLNPDRRLYDAEIVLHDAITKIDRIKRNEREPACTGVLVHSEYERCPRCDR